MNIGKRSVDKYFGGHSAGNGEEAAPQKKNNSTNISEDFHPVQSIFLHIHTRALQMAQ